jgi:hypothetical protein
MIDGYYVSVIDVEKLLCSKLGIKWSATDISMSVDSLADRLLAATPSPVSPEICYDVLHEYADEHRLDFNALCSTVREAVFQGIAASSSAPQVPAVPVWQPIETAPKDGAQRDESGAMGCTADRYAAPAEAQEHFNVAMQALSAAVEWSGIREGVRHYLVQTTRNAWLASLRG